MTEDLRMLRAQIDALVRTIPGVVELYPPGSSALHALAAGAVSAVNGADPGSPVRVSAVEESLLVEVALGVGTAHATPQVVRAVYGALQSELSNWGVQGAQLEVTALHVESGA